MARKNEKGWATYSVRGVPVLVLSRVQPVALVVGVVVGRVGLGQVRQLVFVLALLRVGRKAEFFVLQ